MIQKYFRYRWYKLFVGDGSSFPNDAKETLLVDIILEI